MFVAGGRNETKKRRLLKLIKQQLFALSATRSIGFCIKLPVPVVTMSGAAFRVALCHRGQRILGLLPTSASLAICREHHHVDGRQQAEDVQLGSHSPPLIFGGWHQKARRRGRRGRDWRRRLARVDPPFSGIATNDFEQSRCRRVTLRK